MTNTNSASSGCRSCENRPNGPWTVARSPGRVPAIRVVKFPRALMVSAMHPGQCGLDAIVNNAGIGGPDTDVTDTAYDAFWDVLRVNLSGVFHCIRSAVPLLRPGGRVVNIASVSAFLGVYGQANYASAKAGVVALTKVTARELAKQRITVNAVAPGPIPTELLLKGKTNAEIEEFRKMPPLERLGKPEDVAGVVSFLAGPDGAWINGQVVRANGGFA